ncbi:TRAF3-interacting protein 1 [Cichlidogyrus casuarinus]|uniref:TRAF3-interacting protein 1 n=1 Tax=Cichlidogyrus casuarinus TaxID=1844966 RepID=A0ABD2QC74_9PLAT
MTEIGMEIVKKTQTTMGSLIKKPPLTEKLLLRPPLRFLHDICTSFMKVTGLLVGLYTDEELNPDAMKDKDKKLNFLNKLIDYVTIAHQHPLNVKSSAIIAGKECDKTNELLVKLAECVDKVSDNEEIVSRALRGDAKMIKDKTRLKSTSKMDDRASQERLVSCKPSSRKDSLKEKHTKSKSSKPIKLEEEKQSMVIPEDPQPVKIQRPSSAKGHRKRKEDFNAKSKPVDVNMATPVTGYSNVVTELEKAKNTFKNVATAEEVSKKELNLDDTVRRRERDATEKEMETIKLLLKTLCKSAQPFGKLIQKVHEELDAMQQDFDKWHTEKLNHESAVKNKKAPRPKDETINSLKKQLIDSQSRIEAYRENIRVARATVCANEEKIKRLVDCACGDA